jgi:hypothetical protein
VQWSTQFSSALGLHAPSAPVSHSDPLSRLSSKLPPLLLFLGGLRTQPASAVDSEERAGQERRRLSIYHPTRGSPNLAQRQLITLFLLSALRRCWPGYAPPSTAPGESWEGQSPAWEAVGKCHAFRELFPPPWAAGHWARRAVLHQVCAGEAEGGGRGAGAGPAAPYEYSRGPRPCSALLGPRIGREVTPTLEGALAAPPPRRRRAGGRGQAGGGPLGPGARSSVGAAGLALYVNSSDSAPSSPRRR